MLTQTELGFALAWRNSRLFADHFLEQKLPGEDYWRSINDDELATALHQITAIYNRHAKGLNDTTNESVTEKDFVQPVLDLIWNEPSGECYQVQQLISIPGAKRKPDYAMFANNADRIGADVYSGTPQYWRTAISLGDAKAWGASLDKLRGAESPSAQITDYLYRSKVRWGILTNGAQWRLYEREASAPGGVWFEVDLLRIIAHQDLEAFRWFYFFFRRESFIALPGACSAVDRVLEGSKQYATDVGNSLKESVYDALRMLMNGFFAETANKLDPSDATHLKQVHESSLIVLYRLLFLLFAEDKRVEDGYLLPVENDTYKNYSLAALHQDVHDKLRAQDPRRPSTFARIGKQLWSRICDLFKIIDQGYKQYRDSYLIPAYNGGLFSPQQHPHIAYEALNGARRWEIGDSYIAEVIDRLAYKREQWDEPGREDIDYATLDVRHLGSIYEGLLELRPALAAADLVEVADGKKITFTEAATLKAEPKRIKGAPPRRIAAGEVYLITDRGERKATGSYYTPSYIVNYIVEQTVGPLATHAALQAAKLSNAVDLELKRLRAEIDKLTPASVIQRSKLERELRDCRQRLLEPYLSLKILDPAMGSGHFLVGAADFLSQKMANDNTLTLLYEPPASEDPQEHYKRLVVEHCLYGVDLNPLAVELAKLSLWLHTVSRDKALSFLDHHLRCGNSLIGARIEEDLTTTPPSHDAKQRKRLIAKGASRQMMLGFSQALEGKDLAGFLDSFRQIVERPTDSAKDEHVKEEIYAALDAQRGKYRGVANLWLAPYFGVAVSDQQYGQAVEALNASGLQCDELYAQDWFIAAQRAAQAKRFFHWELEFPEAFFELTAAQDSTGGTPTQTAKFKPKDQRGFDAVIGNPPYVNVTGLESYIRDYILERFLTAKGRVDLYIAFNECAYSLIKTECRYSFIQPIKFCVYAYGKLLRERILQYYTIESILNISQIRVFDDPSTYPCVTVISNIPAIKNHMVAVHKATERSYKLKLSESSELHIETIFIPQNRFSLTPEKVLSLQLDERTWIMLERLSCSSYVLGNNYDIDQCIRIGSEEKRKKLTDRSVDNLSTKEAPWKKMIDGEDLERYNADWQGVWLNYIPAELYNPKNPELLDSPKILIKRIAERLSVVVDDGLDSADRYYPLNTIYAAVSKCTNNLSLHYIAAIMNSLLLDWWYKTLFESIAIRGGYVEFREYLVYLPVRCITFTTMESERKLLLEHSSVLYANYLESGNSSKILTRVSERLPPNPDKSDVVHDLLAFLAEEMMRLHKERLAEARGFLNWLGGYLGMAVDDMTGKTKLVAYYDPAVCNGFTGFFAELAKNKRRFHAPDGKPRDPEGREVRAELEREYNASVFKLAPLLRAIDLTDRLIDQLVYKLYGLTPEEISIVEGHG